MNLATQKSPLKNHLPAVPKHITDNKPLGVLYNHLKNRKKLNNSLLKLVHSKCKKMTKIVLILSVNYLQIWLEPVSTKKKPL